ncbi:MAG: hypothetical protein V1874_10475 [Spirochaetota bacterium]
MKNKIIIILMILLFSSILAGEEKKDNSASCPEPENFIPAKSELIIKTAKISRVIDFLNSNGNINFGNLIIKNIKSLQALKDKAGVDLLNTKFLKEYGIDANKNIFIASYEYETNKADTAFYIPITDKKNFPFNFIKLIKIMGNENNKKDTPDLNPAVSTYKGIKVFEMPNRMFFTVIDNYFVITSTGNLLTEIMELKLKGCDSSLSMDQLYKEYKTKSGADTDLNITNIFIKKDFLERSYKKADPAAVPNNNKPSQKSNLDFIRYVSIGMGSENDELYLKAIFSINKQDEVGELLTQAITTGMFENALYADNITGYHFLSIDINKIYSYLSKSAEKTESTPKSYQNLLKQNEILKQMLLPCSKSFINIIFKKPANIGEMDNFILYIPMKECGEIKETLKIIKNEVKKRHPEEGTFGEEKINNLNSFWFTNDNNNRIFILEHKENIYAGNSVEIIQDMLNSQDKHSIDIKKDFIKRIDKNTFLVSFTQFNDESFLKAVLMMLAYNKNNALYGFISKIENINLIGKKSDDDLSFNFRIKMLNSKK